MPYFNYKDYQVHYQEYGTGPALLLLNGIFMSCRSWQDFIPALSRNNRLILLDFLDQGLSSKATEEYQQDVQVQITLALLNHLTLEKAHVVGISYGGEIAIQLALSNPERINKLVLSNTAAATTHWLRDIGHGWEFACKSYDGHQFFKACIPIVYSPAFYEANYSWLVAREDLFVTLYTPEVYDGFVRLIRSAEQYNVLAQLKNVQAKTLVISSEHDYVTPVFQQQQLVQGILQADHVMLQGAGHAAMYEKPTAFVSLVLGFVAVEEEIVIS